MRAPSTKHRANMAAIYRYKWQEAIARAEQLEADVAAKDRHIDDLEVELKLLRNQANARH